MTKETMPAGTTAGTPQVLLAHHLKQLKLPTVLRVAAWPGSVEELPVASRLESPHPVLKLLGPVELVGARGELPSRAMKQCAEYCAWLLEHPGGSAGEMKGSSFDCSKNIH